MDGTGSIEVAAPAERVIALLADPARMASWNSQTIDARWVPPADRPAVGARFVQLLQGESKALALEYDVVAYDPAREYAYRSRRPGGLGTVWGFRVEPRDGGVLLRYDLHGPKPSLVARWFLRRSGIPDDQQSMVDDGVRETLASIKRAAEAG